MKSEIGSEFYPPVFKTLDFRNQVLYFLLHYRLLRALWIKLTLQQDKNCAHMIIRKWRELFRYVVEH